MGLEIVENVGEKVLRVPDKQVVVPRREEYLELVDRLLEIAFQRVLNKYTKNPEKISWARVAAQLVKAGADVLRDSDLEDLVRRVEVLERGEK